MSLIIGASVWVPRPTRRTPGPPRAAPSSETSPVEESMSSFLLLHLWRSPAHSRGGSATQAGGARLPRDCCEHPTSDTGRWTRCWRARPTRAPHNSSGELTPCTQPWPSRRVGTFSPGTRSRSKGPVLGLQEPGRLRIDSPMRQLAGEPSMKNAQVSWTGRASKRPCSGGSCFPSGSLTSKSGRAVVAAQEASRPNPARRSANQRNRARIYRSESVTGLSGRYPPGRPDLRADSRSLPE